MTQQVARPQRTQRRAQPRTQPRTPLLAAAVLAAATAAVSLPLPRASAQDAAVQVQDTAAQDTAAQDPAAPDAPADAPAPDAPAPDAPAPDAPDASIQDPPPPAPSPAPERMTDPAVTTETTTESTRTTVRMEDPNAADNDAFRRRSGARVRGQDDAQVTGDKSSYGLTNPVPESMMRPLSSDRPDVTESPYTVDAGHFQVEASFFEYARDAGGAVTEFSLIPFIAKVGVTNNIDVELGLQPFTDVDVDFGGGNSDGSSGFGPILLRAKINLWGNDGGGAPFDLPDNFPDNLRERWGDSAFALIPYVRIPTGNDDIGPEEVEFGVAAPLQTPLTDEWDLGLMGDLAFVRGDGDGSYKLEFLHTASFSRNLGGRLNGFGEYIGVLTGSEGTRYLASVGVGLVYELSRNLQVDAAINVGLNEDAEDFRFLTGFTYRR